MWLKLKFFLLHCGTKSYVNTHPWINYYCIGFQPSGFCAETFEGDRCRKPLDSNQYCAEDTYKSFPKNRVNTENQIWTPQCQMGSGSGVFPNLLSCKKFCYLFLQYGVPSPLLTIELNSTILQITLQSCRTTLASYSFSLPDETTPSHKLAKTFFEVSLFFTFTECSPDSCLSLLHLSPYSRAVLLKYQSDYVSSLFNKLCLPLWELPKPHPF